MRERVLRHPGAVRAGAVVVLAVILVVLLLMPDDPPPDVIAYDRFDRTVAEGLGEIDRGGGWQLSGTKADYRVAGGLATVVVSEPGSTRKALLPDVREADVEVLFEVTLETAPTEGGAFVYAIVRHRDLESEVRAKIRIAENGAVYLGITGLVEGEERELSPEARLEDVAWTPGTALRIRARAEGDPAVIRVKVWPAQGSEPASWSVRTNTAEGAVEPSGSVGVQFYVSRTSTAFPFTYTIRSFEVRRPPSATPSAAGDARSRGTVPLAP